MGYFGRTAMLIGLATATLPAAEGWTGLAFTDYYYIAAHHIPSSVGQNGFQFRRIYLTYTTSVAEQLTARLRFEGASTDFTNRGAKITPFVKDAYLQWSRGEHKLTFGLSGTPTFALVEAHWGYRSVKKSPQDLHQFGSSRDFGISMQGPLGKGGYFVMLGNGAGISSETNRYKKVYATLNYPLGTRVNVEGYVDYEPGDEGRGLFSVFTLQGHVQVYLGALQVGLLALRQTLDNSTIIYNRDLLSVFGRWKLSEKWTGLGRIDYLPRINIISNKSPNTPVWLIGKPLVIIAGVDYRATDDLHLLPTVEMINYTIAPGSTWSADLYVRLTAYVKF